MDEVWRVKNYSATNTRPRRDVLVLSAMIYSDSIVLVSIDTLSQSHCCSPLALYLTIDEFAGNVVNKPEHGSLDWVKICEKSSKVITFIDLAGHERYLKTTVFGMTGHAPDFGKT